MERIVVGVDDSVGARSALRWALAEAQLFGASVEAVHVYQFELAWIDATDEHVEQWRQDAARKAAVLLSEVVAGVAGRSPSVPVKELVIEGQPAAALVQAADKNADLLVVGSRGRGGLAGMLLGSVSRRCIEHSPCPVVVVPPHAMDLGMSEKGVA
jgi:nucleotide-binding universal stress UspA family protein